MGLEKPPVKYVDGAYVSADKLVEAQAEGREIIGPAQPAPRKDGKFSAEDFRVEVEERRASCPAGKTSTQCSRLEEQSTGKVSYRFEWSTHCQGCPLRSQCVGKDQPHRTLTVGEDHTILQARRQEQKTEAFQHRMSHRNGIEGTRSELVQGHGMRRHYLPGAFLQRMSVDGLSSAPNPPEKPIPLHRNPCYGLATSGPFTRSRLKHE
jgi:transposase